MMTLPGFSGMATNAPDDVNLVRVFAIEKTEEIMARSLKDEFGDYDKAFDTGEFIMMYSFSHEKDDYPPWYFGSAMDSQKSVMLRTIEGEGYYFQTHLDTETVCGIISMGGNTAELVELVGETFDNHELGMPSKEEVYSYVEKRGLPSPRVDDKEWKEHPL